MVDERQIIMKNYIIKRLLLIPLTLLGILIVNFAIIQFSPGGPVEYVLAKYQGMNTDSKAQFTSTPTSSALKSSSSYQGARGVPQDLIDDLNKQFGFDKPWYIRFYKMVKDYACFDFGKSYYQDKTVSTLILERMPVSVSLGLWSILLIYLISIPLGIKKALQDGTKFDFSSTLMLTIFSAIPVFLFAVFLIVFFAGGTYFQWFPLRGLTSDYFETLTTIGKIKDYFWHIALPILSVSIGGFAGLTMLTKNSFLDEISKPYVMTAKAKGLSDRTILYKHVFKNAMLIIIAGFPSVLIKMLFTGSVLIEVVFSLNGLGLLGYEAIMTRDYPVIFGTLYIFALIGLVLKLISDITYCLVDPRINFEKI